MADFWGFAPRLRSALSARTGRESAEFRRVPQSIFPCGILYPSAGARFSLPRASGLRIGAYPHIHTPNGRGVVLDLIRRLSVGPLRTIRQAQRSAETREAAGKRTIRFGRINRASA